MKMVGASRVISAVAVMAATGVALAFGLHMARASAREGIYRDRLQQLAGEYQSLRTQYNQAVRQTTLTELVVKDGELAVRVRTAEGTIAEIATPFDPSGEVFVDYAVLDGRVWIRRVFDSNTPPSQGIVIDPSLAQIDWDASGASMGKAVYRSLSEGRWVISVAGNGALGLTRAQTDEPATLSPPPEIGDYAELEEDLDAELDRIGLGQLWARVIGG